MSSASASRLEVPEHNAGHGLSRGHCFVNILSTGKPKRNGPLLVMCISMKSFKMTLAKDLGGEGHPCPTSLRLSPGPGVGYHRKHGRGGEHGQLQGEAVAAARVRARLGESGEGRLMGANNSVINTNDFNIVFFKNQVEYQIYA